VKTKVAFNLNFLSGTYQTIPSEQGAARKYLHNDCVYKNQSYGSKAPDLAEILQ
jgi:hypothetical protein